MFLRVAALSISSLACPSRRRLFEQPDLLCLFIYFTLHFPHVNGDHSLAAAWGAGNIDFGFCLDLILSLRKVHSVAFVGMSYIESHCRCYRCFVWLAVNMSLCLRLRERP